MRRVAKGREWGAGPETVMEAHVHISASSEHRSLIGIHLPGDTQPGCRVAQSPRLASGGERRYIPQSPRPPATPHPNPVEIKALMSELGSTSR